MIITFSTIVLWCVTLSSLTRLFMRGVLSWVSLKYAKLSVYTDGECERIETMCVWWTFSHLKLTEWSFLPLMAFYRESMSLHWKEYIWCCGVDGGGGVKMMIMIMSSLSANFSVALWDDVVLSLLLMTVSDCATEGEDESLLMILLLLSFASFRLIATVTYIFPRRHCHCDLHFVSSFLHYIPHAQLGREWLHSPRILINRCFRNWNESTRAPTTNCQGR